MSGLFLRLALRYIALMSEPGKTRYLVSVLENVGGRLGWHHLLRTDDKDAADALYAALAADDGVKVKFQVLPPGVME